MHDSFGDSTFFKYFGLRASTHYVICGHTRENSRNSLLVGVVINRHNVTWREFFIRRSFLVAFEVRSFVGIPSRHLHIKKRLSFKIDEQKLKTEKTAKNRILSILIIYSTSKIKYEDSTLTAPTKQRLSKMADQFDVVSLPKMFFKLGDDFSEMAMEELSSICGDNENGHLRKCRRPF